MSYRVIFKQAAQWEFERLTQGQRKAIAAKIDELETNPEPPGAIRLEGYPKFWRPDRDRPEFRSGDLIEQWFCKSLVGHSTIPLFLGYRLRCKGTIQNH